MGKPKVQQWEYYMVCIEKTESFCEALRELGEKGWENYAIISKSFGDLFFFKRPLP